MLQKKKKKKNLIFNNVVFFLSILFWAIMNKYSEISYCQRNFYKISTNKIPSENEIV